MQFGLDWKPGFFAQGRSCARNRETVFIGPVQYSPNGQPTEECVSNWLKLGRVWFVKTLAGPQDLGSEYLY